MTDDSVNRLRELEASATPGLWRTWNDGHVGAPDHHLGGICMPTPAHDPSRRQADAELIAAMRNELVPLLDRLEDAEARASAAEAERKYRPDPWTSPEDRTFLSAGQGGFIEGALLAAAHLSEGTTTDPTPTEDRGK